jgi:hypothetical protein
MPRILVLDACGVAYRIDTLSEQRLKGWFNEWLPKLWPDGDPRMAPRINVQPLFRGRDGTGDPDWLCDTRVMGRDEPFPARTGKQGMRQLQELRHRLEAELEQIKAERGR